jgi:hypothetical protein
MERRSFNAFSTEMPPSVRGSGSLITLDASAFEELLFSETANPATARRANPAMITIHNLFIIPPTGFGYSYAFTDVAN